VWVNREEVETGRKEQFWRVNGSLFNSGCGRLAMAQEVVADGLPLTTRHRMGFLSAQDVRHMNCNADEECILQDRALLLRPVANMALVLFPIL
jgi:hypothetical protein